MMKELLEKIISIEGIRGAVTVKSDDGSRVYGVGDSPSVLDDISAFVGSCGDVTSKLLKLNGFKNLKFYTENNAFLIFPWDDVYIGIILEKESDIDEAIKQISRLLGFEADEESVKEESVPKQESESAAPVTEEELPSEDEEVNGKSLLTVSPNIKKFIETKVLQINYLIDEFAGNGSKDDWLQNVIYSLKTIDKNEKMSNALVEENGSVYLHIENLSNDINENEISTISKGIIDELCKLAVRRYGTDQTKQKIQSVIKKITKSKVG